jgi:hypothetical protein
LDLLSTKRIWISVRPDGVLIDSIDIESSSHSSESRPAPVLDNTDRKRLKLGVITIDDEEVTLESSCSRRADSLANVGAFLAQRGSSNTSQPFSKPIVVVGPFTATILKTFGPYLS